MSSTLTSPHHTASFTLFPRLPTEIRLQIWRESCVARVVDIRYNTSQDRCITRAKYPTILAICCESRCEGLLIYQRAFGTKSHPAAIYFAPALDVIYMPRCGEMGYDDSARDFALNVPATVHLVRRLAVDLVYPERRRPWETYNKFCLLRSFPNLIEAYIILQSGHASTSSKTSDTQESSYPATTTTATPGGQYQIEFVNPTGDRRALVRVMQSVEESFWYEVGPASQAVHCEAEPVPTHSTCGDTYLSLIPKAKAETSTRDDPLVVSCI